MKEQAAKSTTNNGSHAFRANNAHQPFFNAGGSFFNPEVMQKKETPFFSETPSRPFFNPIQRQEISEEEESLQGKFKTIQRQGSPEEDELLQGKFEPQQQQENKTALPDQLKTGIEHLSGYSMDDVKVHYNSPNPPQLQAHAYAQGTNIHVASGQEKHLPHEAWHVVQQKQGRVKPTMQLKGKVKVNDDVGLEKEADVMGRKALWISSRSITLNDSPTPLNPAVQRKAFKNSDETWSNDEDEKKETKYHTEQGADKMEPTDRVHLGLNMTMIDTPKESNRDERTESKMDAKTNGETPKSFRNIIVKDGIKTVKAGSGVLQKMTQFVRIYIALVKFIDEFRPKSDWDKQLSDEKDDVHKMGDNALNLATKLNEEIKPRLDAVEEVIEAAQNPNIKKIEINSLYETLVLAKVSLENAQNELANFASNNTVPGLMRIARIGIDMEDAKFVNNVGEIADRGQSLANDRSLDLPNYEARTSASYGAQTLIWAKDIWGTGDFMNNLAGIISGAAGLAGGTIGGLIGSLIFSAFGALFGAIGVFFAARAATKSEAKATRLLKLIPQLSNEKAKEIAHFARTQKVKKGLRARAVTAVSGVAVVAGGMGALSVPAVAGWLGLAAGTVATLGIGAAIAGILAASIGIGIVGWKWRHGRKKREQTIDAFVTGVMDNEKKNPADQDQKATNLWNKANKKKKDLRVLAVSELKSERQKMAESIIHMLVAGKPSEQLDAERLIRALGRDPKMIRTQVGGGDKEGAYAIMKGKLSSW